MPDQNAHRQEEKDCAPDGVQGQVPNEKKKKKKKGRVSRGERGKKARYGNEGRRSPSVGQKEERGPDLPWMARKKKKKRGGEGKLVRSCSPGQGALVGRRIAKPTSSQQRKRKKRTGAKARKEKGPVLLRQKEKRKKRIARDGQKESKRFFKDERKKGAPNRGALKPPSPEEKRVPRTWGKRCPGLSPPGTPLARKEGGLGEKSRVHKPLGRGEGQNQDF